MRKRILISIILIILIIFTINIPETHAGILSDAISGGKVFIKSGAQASVNETELVKTSNDIYNALLIISFVVVAIVGIILGIKYMMAGVEEKADVKKSLTIFVIGAIVSYGAFGIWRVLAVFLQKSGLL